VKERYWKVIVSAMFQFFIEF